MASPGENRTFYDLLHVSRDAPPEIIRSSYRALMQALKCHPDLGGDTERAAAINRAYAVLSDADRRRRYDAQLALLESAGEACDFDDTITGEAAANDEQPAPETPRPPGSQSQAMRCVFCSARTRKDVVIGADSSCHDCGSPLAVAKGLRIEAGGQRSVLRLQKTREIGFFTGWPQARPVAAQTRDISLNGLSFVAREPLQIGQRIKVTSSVLEAVAEVTRCKKEEGAWAPRFVIGVSYLTLRFVRSVGGFVSEQV